MRKTLSKSFMLSVFCICLTNSSFAGDFGENINISGYGNAHLIVMDGMPRVFDDEGADDQDDSTIQLREFSLYLDVLVTDGVFVSTEIEAGDNGNRFTANYAYVDVDIGYLADFWDEDLLGNFSFRAGKILVPFLSYNENKPNFKQNLMSPPFTAANFAPVIRSGDHFYFHGFGWSDVGIMVNWNRMIGELGVLDLKMAVINGLGSDSDVLDADTLQLNAGISQPFVRHRNGLIHNEENNELHDNNNDKALTTKIMFKSSHFPMDAGISWYRGIWDKDAEKDLNLLGAHFNWLAPNWTLKGEYGFGRVEQEEGTDPVADAGKTGPVAINTSTDDYSMQAWYVEGSFIPLRYGKEQDNYLRLVMRYDEVDTNDEAEFTPFDRWRVTPGMEWQFTKNTRLRYEFQYSEINDFGDAPQAYKDAGGKNNIETHMLSIIFYF